MGRSDQSSSSGSRCECFVVFGQGTRGMFCIEWFCSGCFSRGEGEMCSCVYFMSETLWEGCSEHWLPEHAQESLSAEEPGCQEQGDCSFLPWEIREFAISSWCGALDLLFHGLILFPLCCSAPNPLLCISSGLFLASFPLAEGLGLLRLFPFQDLFRRLSFLSSLQPSAWHGTQDPAAAVHWCGVRSSQTVQWSWQEHMHFFPSPQQLYTCGHAGFAMVSRWKCFFSLTKQGA